MFHPDSTPLPRIGTNFLDRNDMLMLVEEVRANARERRRIRMEHLHSISQST